MLYLGGSGVGSGASIVNTIWKTSLRTSAFSLSKYCYHLFSVDWICRSYLLSQILYISICYWGCTSLQMLVFAQFAFVPIGTLSLPSFWLSHIVSPLQVTCHLLNRQYFLRTEARVPLFIRMFCFLLRCLVIRVDISMALFLLF